MNNNLENTTKEVFNCTGYQLACNPPLSKLLRSACNFQIPLHFIISSEATVEEIDEFIEVMKKSNEQNEISTITSKLEK